MRLERFGEGLSFLRSLEEPLLGLFDAFLRAGHVRQELLERRGVVACLRWRGGAEAHAEAGHLLCCSFGAPRRRAYGWV